MRTDYRVYETNRGIHMLSFIIRGILPVFKPLFTHKIVGSIKVSGRIVKTVFHEDEQCLSSFAVECSLPYDKEPDGKTINDIIAATPSPFYALCESLYPLLQYAPIAAEEFGEKKWSEFATNHATVLERHGSRITALETSVRELGNRLLGLQNAILEASKKKKKARKRP